MGWKLRHRMIALLDEALRASAVPTHFNIGL